MYSAHWANPTGAVSDDLYLVLSDYYSPAFPDGDEVRLTDLSLSAGVGFGPSGSQSSTHTRTDEWIPITDARASASSSSTGVSPPPPPPPPPPTARTTLPLTEVLIAPAGPYRCVSPFARDHSGRLELELRYASGATRSWVSTGSFDKSDNFLFCGGSITYDLPGYASAPIRFQETGSITRVVSVRGILGADRDEGALGRRVELAVSYAGVRTCDIATDSAGHARRFSCRGFPNSGSLAGLELRLDVAGDRRLGVFAGIAELEAVVEKD